MYAAATGGVALALAPYLALAAEGEYEAMVLACIDPRMQEPVHRYTVEQKLTGKFSQFVIAGAAIGVVAPALKEWHQAFWDNLGTSIQLIHQKGDCDRPSRLRGRQDRASRGQGRKPQIETETHQARLRNFASKSENATRNSVSKPA